MALMSSTAKGCLLGVALVVVVVALVVLFVPPSHPPDSPSTPDHPPVAGGTEPLPRFKEARFGCAHREYFEKVLDIFAQGDNEAAQAKIHEGVLTGECTIFEKGEQVYMTIPGLSLFAPVQVRRQGETAEYWTDYSWLDVHPQG
jgi:hypothetical protein